MRYFVLFFAIAGCLLLSACNGYDVKIYAEPAVVRRGGEGEFHIKLEARGKYHLEPEGLVIIIFTPPSFIKMDKTEFRQEDKKAENFFSAPFTVEPDAAAGEAVTKVDITFQVCTETQCLIIEDHRQVKVKIQ